MKELLNARNLMSTHYDNGDHVLEFQACCMKLFVTVRGLGHVDNEHYWDNENNLQAAIANVSDEDIDVYFVTKGGKEIKLIATNDGITWEGDLVC